MTHAAATHSGSALYRCVATIAALSLAPADAKAAQDAQVFPRVRTHSAIIGTAIAEGTDRSETFRRLVNEIGASDGLVYVEEGECGHSVNACAVIAMICGSYSTPSASISLGRSRTRTRAVLT